MLNTTKDFDMIYKCADLLGQPAPAVLRGVLDDYATLAAAALRLVEVVRWRDEVFNCVPPGGDFAYEELADNNYEAEKEYVVALAEVEALLSETPPKIDEDGAG